LSKSNRAAPELDWVPLRRAVFVLHEEGDKCPGIDAASLLELAEVLAAKSEAQTSIDPNAQSFFLQYVHNGLDGMKGPPWAILGEAAGPSDFEVFGGTYGRDAESGARTTRRYEAMHEATAFVWRELMLPTFDRAVSLGAAILYARPQTASANFEQLPADLWPLLNVVDWNKGAAVGPNGCQYWSIHVEFVTITDSSTKSLRQAPRSVIHKAIKAAYDNAEADGSKPPNIKELPAVVRPLLEAKGYNASGKLIMLLGSAEQHARRRRPPVKTVRSERGASTK